MSKQPFSGNKLRDLIDRPTPEGHRIPDHVARTVKGGRISIDLAERFAFKTFSYNCLSRWIKEPQNLPLACRMGNKIDSVQDRVDRLKFLATAVGLAKEYCRRPGAVPGVQSEERNYIFERYAAYLNYFEIMGEVRLDLHGVDRVDEEDKGEEMLSLKEFLDESARNYKSR